VGVGVDDALAADQQGSGAGRPTVVLPLERPAGDLLQPRPDALPHQLRLGRVVPVDRRRRDRAVCGNVKAHDLPAGERVRAAFRDLRLDPDHVRSLSAWFPQTPQLEGFEGQVDRMRPPAAQAAGAEVPPAAPALFIAEVIGTEAGRAEPDVPIQAFGHGLTPLGPLPRSAAAEYVPHVGLAQFAQQTVLDQFHRSTERVGGHPLIAHLRGDSGFLGNPPQGTGLRYIVRDGLLAVDVFAAGHGSRRDHGMGVFGRGHDQPVELTVKFVQQFAKVLVLGSVGCPLGRDGQTVLIGVANRHQVLAHPRHRADMIRPAGAHAHDGQVQPLVRLGGPRRAAVMKTPPSRRRRDGGLEKSASTR